MGCCFSSSEEDSSESAERRHLLTGSATPVVQSQRAVSVRKYRPGPQPVHTNSDPQPITVRPTKVSHVDKRIQDHVTLYNLHMSRLVSLREAVEEMKAMFPEANPQHTLIGCYRAIQTFSEEHWNLGVSRRYQYCMEIHYEGNEVLYTVIPAFLAFNKANRLIKDIIEKGPGIITSVQMVIEMEKELRRDVLVASLGADGPDSMKNCMDAVAQLQHVPKQCDLIKQEALQTFEELKKAAHQLAAAKTEQAV